MLTMLTVEGEAIALHTASHDPQYASWTSSLQNPLWSQ